MAHQRLNGLEIVSFIQKGRPKGVPGHMRVDSLLNQGLLCHGFNQAINSLGGQSPFLVGAVLPQCFEHRPIRINTIP